MCGLVGVICNQGGLWKGDIEKFMYMLLINSMRGMDSTGMFTISKKLKEVDFLKVLGGPSHLFHEDVYEKITERAAKECDAIIGHGRLATIGEVSAKNAHPFVVDNISLVHNGTLSNFDQLRKKHNLVNVKVDSLLCAHLLNKLTPEEFKEEIEGAYAFIWYDSRDGFLYVMKNSERPLYLHKTTYSTWMLSSDVNAFDYLEKKMTLNGEVKAFDVDAYYKFDLSGNIEKKEVKKKYSPTIWTAPFASRSDPPYRPQQGTRTVCSILPGFPDIKSGTVINFIAIDFKQIAGATGYYVIDGLLEDDQSTDVKVFYKGDHVEEMKKHVVLSTVVDYVSYKINDKNQAEYMISGNELMIPVGEEKEELIELMNAKLPKKEVLELIKDGCAYCSSPLKLSSIDYCSYHNHQIFCIQCSTQGSDEFNVLH